MIETQRVDVDREFFASLAAYDRAREDSPLVEPILPPDVDLEEELIELFRRITE